jgi:tetratricopeptide (TPR) repeat protein
MNVVLEKFDHIRSILKAEKKNLLESLEALEKESVSFEDQEDRDEAFLEIVKALADVKEWDKANKFLSKIKNNYEKTEATIFVSNCLFQMGEKEKASNQLLEAETLAYQINSFLRKADMLHEIASLYAKMGELIRAKSVWHKAITVAREGEKYSDMQDSLECSSVLGAISITLAKVGEINEAIEVANFISHSYKKQKTLEIISSSTK